MVRVRGNSCLEGSSNAQDDKLHTFYEPQLHPSNNQPKQFRKMYLAAFAAITNGLSMGLVLGYSSPAILSLEEPCSYFHLKTSEEPWFASLMILGGLFGGLCGGPATAYIGRKDSLILSSILLSFGWLIIPYVNTIALLYFARILTGFCSGLISTAAPMYVVEISTAEVRGLLGASFQLALVIGVLLAMVLGYYMSWEWLAVSCSIISAVSLILLTPMPKSPRWLIMKKKNADAIAAIKFLQGNRVDPEKECQRIETEIQSQLHGSFHWKDALDPCVWKSFLLSMGLMYFQQFSGVTAIMFYASKIFESTGSSLDSQVASIIIAAVQVVATFLSCILMDRAGRKLLLLICSIGTSLSLGTMGTYFYLSSKQGEPFEKAYSWMALLSLMVFMGSYAMGMGPLPWLMLAEMVPQRVRSVITAMITGLTWTTGFFVTNMFPLMQDKLYSYGTYWFFCANCSLCILFSAFLLPETKGKTIQEIQKIFSGRASKRITRVASTASVKELVEQ